MKFSQATSELINSILTNSGFKAMEDFTAVDSLIYKNNDIGFYSLNGCDIVGECLSCDGLTYSVELECEFEIRLMSKSTNYADFKSFDDLCSDFYESLVCSEELLIKNMKMGKPYQSMPLKRLERDMTLKVRTSIGEELSDGN